jgi:hypothetical protein
LDKNGAKSNGKKFNCDDQSLCRGALKGG